MKVGFITAEYYENRPYGASGSSRIRGEFLFNREPDFHKFELGEHYDVIVYQKAYWEEHMKSFDGVKIFDICDPDWMDGRPVFEAIDLCDGVVTSSEKLKVFIEKLTDKPVICIPDRIDLNEFGEGRSKPRTLPKTAIWFGYSDYFDVVDELEDGIKSNNLFLTVISNQRYNGFCHYPMLYDRDTIIEEIKKHDIAVLPKKDDLRWSFKTNNKETWCRVLGVPVVENREQLDKICTDVEFFKSEWEKITEYRIEYDVQKSIDEYKAFINTLVQSRHERLRSGKKGS